MSKHTAEYLKQLQRHQSAYNNPYPGFETAIVHFTKGLVAYAEVYHARYGVPISSDHVLATDWLDIARGTIGLLNGDTGRLNCGTIDGLIRGTAEKAGFTLDLADPAQG